MAEKLRRAAGTRFPTEDAAWVESHLLALAGLAEETELGGNRRNEAFSAWRRFLEGLAEQRPLVLVFEDLHWADESLLDFVDELVDWVTDVPLLVVATARPELLERRPGWGGGKLNATTLALAPLTERRDRTASRERARNTRARRRDPGRAARAGRREPAVRGAVRRALRRARLDRRAHAARDAPGHHRGPPGRPQPGREEPHARRGRRRQGVLDRRARRDEGEATARSTRSSGKASFVDSGARRSRARASSPSPTRSCATSPTGRSRAPTARRSTADVAEWIESLGRPEDHAEMRAYHWRSALDLARASGAETDDLVERARFSLRDAGDRASGLNNHAAAASLYDDALGLWPEGDRERPQLLFRRAVALHQAYDEARQEHALEAARDALLAAGDTEHASETEAYLARVFWDRGEHDLVREHLARAEALAGDSIIRRGGESPRLLGPHPEHRGRDRGSAAVSQRRRSRSRPSSVSRSFALTRSRRSAWRRTTSTSGQASRTWSAHSRSPSRRTPRSPQPPSTISPSTRRSPPTSYAPTELYDEAMRLAERYGDASERPVHPRQSHLARLHARALGQALESADAFIAECEAGSPHTMEPFVREVRAAV